MQLSNAPHFITEPFLYPRTTTKTFKDFFFVGAMHSVCHHCIVLPLIALEKQLTLLSSQLLHKDIY